MSRINENAAAIQGAKNPVPFYQPPAPTPGGGASVVETPKLDTLELTPPPATNGPLSNWTLYLKKSYEDLINNGVIAYGYADQGYAEIKRAVETGDWDGPYRKLLDPLLDQSALGPDDAFQDAGGGRLGPLLTNRLGIGESMALNIDVGATIPLEEFLLPNAKLDRGGSLKIARVQKKAPDGTPLSEPKDKNGNPPTELMATVELSGRIGGGYSVKAGVEGTIKLGTREAGVKATVGAGADAGVSGRIAGSFAFAPDSEEDMQVLAWLVKRFSSSSFPASILDVSDAVSGQLGSRLVSFTGEGGLFAQASAMASLLVGVSKSSDAKDLQLAETLREKSKSLLASLNGEFMVAMLNAGGSASANLGLSRDVRTGENTVYAHLNGLLGANGCIPLYPLLSASIEGSRTLAFTYDRDNNLKGIKIQDEVSKEQFNLGLRTVMEDMLGRPLENGLIAQLGTSDAVRVTYNLSPAEFQGLDARSLERALLNKKRAASIEITAVHRDVFDLKGAVSLNLGAEIGLRGGIEGTHEQESDLK